MPAKILAATALGALAAQAKFSVSVPGLGGLEGRSPYRIDETVAVFRGIPYAKPPVGDLRWRAPVAYGPWESPRDAKEYRYSCVGSGDDGSSEDCLFLNVASPVDHLGDASAQRPVMIYIYGGAYDNGGAKEFSLEDTVWYAAQPVVGVTLDYRVNIFGFAGSRALAARSPGDGTGNYGLQDQRMAIAWARDHISAFGGNGQDMTIFGESAGGNSVLHHLVQPASFGLFQKAIMQSATYDGGFPDLSASEAMFDGIAKQMGCANDVECLVNKTASELNFARLKFFAKSLLTGSLPEIHWGPVVDGVSMAAEPQALIASGEFQKDIPILMGSNRDEFSVFIDALNLTTFKPGLTEAGFDNIFGYLGAENLARVKEVYDPAVYEYPAHLGLNSQWWWMAMRVGTDNGIPFTGFARGASLGHCSMRRVAEHLVRGGAPPLFMYSLERAVTAVNQVCHGMDLPFVFHNDKLLENRGLQDLSLAVIQYWTSFAASGNPSGGGLDYAPEWLAYEPDGDMANVRLDATRSAANITINHAYRQAACDFWDSLHHTSVTREVVV